MCKWINKKLFTDREKTIIVEHIRGKTLRDLQEEYGMARSNISRLQKHIRECYPKIYEELDNKAEELGFLDESFIMEFED